MGCYWAGGISGEYVFTVQNRKCFQNYLLMFFQINLKKMHRSNVLKVERGWREFIMRTKGK